MRTNGFTLIELLITIAIIGVLASVVLSSLNSARALARDGHRMAVLENIQKALHLYYDDHGAYPGTNNQYMDIGNCSVSYTNLDTLLVPDYISHVEDEPTDHCLFYQNLSSGAGYYVGFVPERASTLTRDQDCFQPSTWYCVGMAP